MSLNKEKKIVLEYNKKIYSHGLASLSWGNLSVIDRKKKVILIKPSGVNILKIKSNDISVINIKNQKKISGLKPSTDLLTHLEIYKSFKNITSICHTHSLYATIFCQIRKRIKCSGTTHADHFNGDVHVTRKIKKKEILKNYEINCGKIIVEKIKETGCYNSGAILLSNHGPFCWGDSIKQNFENALVLEQCAKMYFKSLLIKSKPNIDKNLAKYHFERKNGPNKYYGQ